jgi:hypothetical protein
MRRLGRPDQSPPRLGPGCAAHDARTGHVRPRIREIVGVGQDRAGGGNPPGPIRSAPRSSPGGGRPRASQREARTPRADVGGLPGAAVWGRMPHRGGDRALLLRRVLRQVPTRLYVRVGAARALDDHGAGLGRCPDKAVDVLGEQQPERPACEGGGEFECGRHRSCRSPRRAARQDLLGLDVRLKLVALVAKLALDLERRRPLPPVSPGVQRRHLDVKDFCDLLTGEKVARVRRPTGHACQCRSV